jgi:hypothetical protein
MVSLHKTFALILLLTGIMPAQASDTRVGEQLVDLPLVDGSHQCALFAVPPNTKAIIIMSPGGSGDIGLSRDGDIRHDHNFVVRTRGLWASKNYAVLIPHTIDRML